MDTLPDYTTLSSMTDAQLQQIFGVRDIFVQEIDFPSLAPSATLEGSFTVQNEANFLWQEGCYFVDVAGADQTINSFEMPLITLNISDSSSGRHLMQSNIPLTSMFGPGMLPFILPTPRFFRANTQVVVDILNFSVATTYRTIKLSFIGTKFYKFAQQI